MRKATRKLSADEFDSRSHRKPALSLLNGESPLGFKGSGKNGQCAFEAPSNHYKTGKVQVRAAGENRTRSPSLPVKFQFEVGTGVPTSRRDDGKLGFRTVYEEQGGRATFSRLELAAQF